MRQPFCNQIYSNIVLNTMNDYQILCIFATNALLLGCKVGPSWKNQNHITKSNKYKYLLTFKNKYTYMNHITKAKIKQIYLHESHKVKQIHKYIINISQMNHITKSNTSFINILGQIYIHEMQHIVKQININMINISEHLLSHCFS